MYARISFAILSIALCVTAGAADPLPRAKPESVGMSTARLARIGETLKADVDKGKLPGAVVAVARNGKLVYYEAIGWRDKEANAPMPKDAIFSIASMTKPMSSVALMQLFEEGKVLVSDPVGKHLPMLANMRVAPDHEKPGETVPAVRQMTVQDILRHTSGLLYGGRGTSALHKMYPPSSSLSGTNMSSEEFLAKLGSLPLAYQPGTVWDYSLSVDVVGLTVEAARGRKLGEVLGERIWKPLGMVDTSFTIPAGKQNRYAHWFAIDPGTGKPDYVLDLTQPLKFECGGGCGASTAGDYVRFAQMLLDKGTLGGAHILSKKTIEYMTSDHVGPDVNNRITATVPYFSGYGFGLGFAVRRADGMGGSIGSAGEFTWGGAYGTSFWVDPKEQLVVAVMSHAPASYRGSLRPLITALVYQAIDSEARRGGKS
jgi:CubicO group peptidase (beta-lactamase class C family)